MSGASGWRPIETAPRDGSKVWARRIYNGSLVAEGWAVFDKMAPDAPMRSPAPGGLYPDIPADNAYADEKRWLKADRRHSFPSPTEWKSEPPTSDVLAGEG